MSASTPNYYHQIPTTETVLDDELSCLMWSFRSIIEILEPEGSNARDISTTDVNNIIYLSVQDATNRINMICETIRSNVGEVVLKIPKGRMPLRSEPLYLSAYIKPGSRKGGAE